MNATWHLRAGFLKVAPIAAKQAVPELLHRSRGWVEKPPSEALPAAGTLQFSPLKFYGMLTAVRDQVTAVLAPPPCPGLTELKNLKQAALREALEGRGHEKAEVRRMLVADMKDMLEGLIMKDNSWPPPVLETHGTALGAMGAATSPPPWLANFWTLGQGLTLVHFSAQLERFVWDRGYA